MGKIFINQLEKIVEKYPFEKVHKIIAHLVLAMLEIRDTKNYLSESIRIISFTKGQILKVIRNLNEDERVEFESEIFNILQVMVVFPDFTGEEIEMIKNFCKKILPKEKRESLENFLKQRFKVITEKPVGCLGFFQYNDLIIQDAIFNVVYGFYEERFVILTTEKIKDKDLLETIIKFYEEKGFSNFFENTAAVSMEKNNEFFAVTFTNYGDSIHVSVEKN